MTGSKSSKSSKFKLNISTRTVSYSMNNIIKEINNIISYNKKLIDEESAYLEANGATMRCEDYSERALKLERIKGAVGAYGLVKGMLYERGV